MAVRDAFATLAGERDGYPSTTLNISSTNIENIAQEYLAYIQEYLAHINERHNDASRIVDKLPFNF